MTKGVPFGAVRKNLRPTCELEPIEPSGIDLVARGRQIGSPMPHRHGTWIPSPGSNARLAELMSLLGCEAEIAPLDAAAFGQRAGALIARATTAPDRSKRRKRKPAKRNPAARNPATGKNKTAH
jgi:hypothetical protein